MVGVGVDLDFVSRAATLRGCHVECFLIHHLGLPPSDARIRGSEWNSIIEWFESHLAGWKGRLLSFGGPVTLLLFVLSNLPIYFFPSSGSWSLWQGSWRGFKGGFFGKVYDNLLVVASLWLLGTGFVVLWWKEV